MNQLKKETWMMLIGALFGALVGSGVNLLLRNLSNFGNWVGFIITMIVVWVAVYILLKILNK